MAKSVKTTLTYTLELVVPDGATEMEIIRAFEELLDEEISFGNLNETCFGDIEVTEKNLDDDTVIYGVYQCLEDGEDGI